MEASFVRYGPDHPVSPVVISVPHAGREYPAALRSALAAPVAVAAALEDRHADTLALAARTNEVAIVATRARAWIDLNRGEDERDPRVDTGARPTRWPHGTKARSGLGLVPRRAGRTDPLWRRRFSGKEVADRIAADHRPYHAALARALEQAHARFGVAVLLDLHSMPPLANGAALVIGDRHGRSAAGRFTRCLQHAAADWPATRNAPYAGGYVLERHGDPAAGIHALQLEVDRKRYLDAGGDRPGSGFPASVGVVRGMLAALADEAFAGFALAAE